MLNCIIASLYTDEIKALLGSQYNSNKCNEEIYKQFYSRIDCTNVNFPVGLNDIKTLEQNNPFIRFHIWSLKGTDYFIEYETEITSYHKFLFKMDNSCLKNVHAALISFRNKETAEIDSHYLHVYNLNKFVAKRYVNKAYENVLTCSHCARKFHPIKNKINMKYNKHVETCLYDTGTKFKMPTIDKSVLHFNNYRYTHSNRFAIYADFETLNKPIPFLCITCTELYQGASGLLRKDEIIKKCKTQNHKAYNFSNCLKCVQLFLLLKKQYSTFCKNEQHVTNPTQNMCDICNANCETIVNKEITHGDDCYNNCRDCKNRVKCEHSSSLNVTRLDPIIYCMVIYDQKLDKVYKIKKYAGSDCVKKFISTLEKLEPELTNLIEEDLPLNVLTKPPHFDKNNVTECYVCLEPFTKKCLKNEEHCHHTGKFRGLSCTRCNLAMVDRVTCNIYMHNLSGFDSHLLIAEYCSSKKTKLKAVPINSQKAKILQLGSFYNILDSLSFQPQSLSNLVETLKYGKSSKNIKFNIVADVPDLCWTNNIFDESKYELCLEKAGFPYHMATSINDLKKIKVFPDKSKFKSTLTGKNIDDQTYKNGKKMFALNKFDNMLDYYKWYCKLDTVLLAEIMVDFKKRSFESFNLSIDGYWTLSSYALSACLKQTNVNIELLTDRSQYEFIEASKRGGLTLAVQRFASSTEGDKVLKKDFKHLINDNLLNACPPKSNHEKYIFDLDFNNLYGSVQTMNMPLHSFKWASHKLCKELKEYYFLKNAQFITGDKSETWVNFHRSEKKLKDDEKEEFFLEIDFDYPKELHSLHSDFPLAPHNLPIQNDILSPKASELLDDLRPNPKSYNSTKLTTTLNGLNKYIVHSAILDFYVSQGLVVKKIHRAISFVSSKFLKKWIDLCTKNRKECVKRGDSIGKNYWKLMVNSCFGKFCEDLKKRRETTFITNSVQAKKELSSPLYESCQLIKEGLLQVIKII